MKRYKSIFVLIYVIFIQHNISAQTNQCTGAGLLAGNMVLTNSSGCIPLTVGVSKGLLSAKNVKYIIDYKGGSPDTYTTRTDSLFTFNKAGIYTIMQVAESHDGKPVRACSTITVQDTIPPVFQIKNCTNGIITITFSASNAYDSYGIDWGDGKIDFITKQTNSINHKYPDSKTYRISVQGIFTKSKCGGRASAAIVPQINSQPSKITRLEVMNGTNAELTIQNPDEIEMLLYKTNPNGSYSSTGKLTRKNNDKIQVLIDTTQYNCFIARPIDSCAAKTESNIVCATLIKAQNQDFSNLISWIPYRYPSHLKSTVVLKNKTVWKTESGSIFSTEDVNPECGKPTCYRLQLETNDAIVLSNEQCINPPPQLCGELSNVYVPDAFSPNGDGVNDLLDVKGLAPKNYQLNIYDRWGNTLFEANTMTQQWNGTYAGKLLPTGSYIYRVKITDRLNNTFSKNGVIQLIR